LVICMSLGIYLLKEYVLIIAFSVKFMPMIELFKWQLIGNIIKIASWLFSYLMLAKAMTKIFISTEILFSFSFVVISIFFINNFGLIGVTYAFTLNYVLYFFAVYLIFRKSNYE
ncbi:MAG: O-antigen flippase, partial [Arcobacter sp.]